MPRSTDLVVADTGPLIALSRVIALSALPDIFGQVWLTQTVLAECTARPDRPEGSAILAAVKEGCLRIRPDTPRSLDWDLDPGEASAIAAALELRARVLVRARQLGKLERIRPLTEHLLATGYFLSDKVIDDALKSVGA